MKAQQVPNEGPKAANDQKGALLLKGPKARSRDLRLKSVTGSESGWTVCGYAAMSAAAAALHRIQ